MRATPALALATTLVVAAQARAAPWSATGSLSITRVSATATTLPDGRVLVAGGYGDGTPPAATTEIYDPKTGTFTAGPTMSVGRALHATVVLADGRFLLVGGRSGDDATTSALSSAEVFDPKTGAFTPTGSMAHRRLDHAAVLLPDGRVLVVGGDDGALFQATAEIWDPKTGGFTDAGSMAGERVLHSATLLGGTVVVAGGHNGDPLATVDLFDAAKGTWAVGPVMAEAHAEHVAVALDATHLLITGGAKTVSAIGTATERLELGKGWSGLPAAPSARASGRGLKLPNGTVLVVCGRSVGGPIAAAEAFDPRTSTWSAAGALAIQRERCAAAVLPDGRVLVAGGASGVNYESSAELYAPAARGAACTASGACASGVCADGVCCDRPCAGACERCDVAASAGSCTAVSGAKNHCPIAGQVCLDGACKAGTGARCTDDGLGFEDTAGRRTSCNAYRCRPADGACYDRCADSTQCAPGFACDGGLCVGTGTADDGGCSTPRGAATVRGDAPPRTRSPAPEAGLVLLVLALVGARRGRRR